jgi:hypothetical protein
VKGDFAITVEAPARSSLRRLLEEVAESSGVQLLITSEAKRGIGCPIGFKRDFTIPAEEVWTITEHALLQGGFYLSALHLGESKIICAHKSSNSDALELGSIEVGIEDLDYLAVHPGFLFSMSLELPNTQASTVADREGGREYHGVELRCTPVGTHRVLLEGLGVGVEKVARELVEIDELNRLRKSFEAMQTGDSKGAAAG